MVTYIIIEGDFCKHSSQTPYTGQVSRFWIGGAIYFSLVNSKKLIPPNPSASDFFSFA